MKIFDHNIQFKKRRISKKCCLSFAYFLNYSGYLKWLIRIASTKGNRAQNKIKEQFFVGEVEGIVTGVSVNVEVVWFISNYIPYSFSAL